MKTYEAMFLLDSTQAAQEWENLRKQIIAMLERRGAVVMNARKWAERKLAYEIKGHKRGTYFLVYFKMAPQSVAILRRDLQLSELVLRNLILVHGEDFKIPEGVGTPEQEPTSRPEGETKSGPNTMEPTDEKEGEPKVEETQEKEK